MRFLFLLQALAVLGSATGALADGFQLENGRYSGGPVVTLILTETQQDALVGDRRLQLTAEQKGQLEAEAGSGPSKVLVYDARRDENDCTCHAWNVAFRFSDEGIDVPHQYLVSDEEAARRQAELEEM